MSLDGDVLLGGALAVTAITLRRIAIPESAARPGSCLSDGLPYAHLIILRERTDHPLVQRWCERRGSGRARGLPDPKPVGRVSVQRDQFHIGSQGR